MIAEDGTILSHRCLKLLEDIKDGGSFNMTNYLVKVGEARKLSEGRFYSSIVSYLCGSTLNNEKGCNILLTAYMCRGISEESIYIG